MPIKVIYDLDTIFSEPIYVKHEPMYCGCSMQNMTPVHPVNDGTAPEYICANCGGVVEPGWVEMQNRYEGHSGYDE